MFRDRWTRKKTPAVNVLGQLPLSRRTVLASLAGGLAMMALRPAALLAAPADPVIEGSSSSRDRSEAIRAIPMDALDNAGRQKVNAVLANVTVFRRLPVQIIQCNPELYLFLVEHPDVTTNLWEVLGISGVALKRTGQKTFNANDGAGTKSDIEFLHVAPETHLLYAVGAYDGSMFSRPVQGGALLLLKSGFIKENDGRDYLTCRLDVFCRVDHLGVELTAKTFQGLIGKSADHNFVESVSFLDQLSQAAAVRSQRVLDLADKLDKVSADDKDKFKEILGRVAQNSSPDPLPIRRLDTQDGGTVHR